METRKAKPEDRPAIRDVARRSLQASYSLGPSAITSAIEDWYSEDRLVESLEDPDRHLLVVERDGQIVALSESDCSADGSEATLLWLHVDPAYRGEGIASTLLDATRAHLTERGVDRIYGRVLEDNAEGNAFYEEHGFEQVGHEEVEIDGRTHLENLWIESDSPDVEAVEDERGRTVYVNHRESETGSIAHFSLVYSDEDLESHYGYHCSNCHELANAMDAMGRIECDNCGNVRKPTRWDAAYM